MRKNQKQQNRLITSPFFIASLARQPEDFDALFSSKEAGTVAFFKSINKGSRVYT